MVIIAENPNVATRKATSAKALTRLVKDLYKNDDQEYILRALEFATKAHCKQLRRSGEPYIEHPIQTALVLIRMRQDAVTIAGALLHDVLEDCAVNAKQLTAEFGAEVVTLVEAVTKLKRIEIPQSAPSEKGAHHRNSEAMKAYNLRKMFIAMARDIRVVLIKLADRLHNVSTLKHMPPDRRLAIAKETLTIYAPIAHRLGIAAIKWQLEDESFKHLMPDKYKSISRMVNRKRREREKYVNHVRTEIEGAMARVGIKCEVSGRSKHLYSFYRKIERYRAQGKRADEIYDLTALRIIIEGNKLDHCYLALEVIHQLWHPIPNQFDDYIASPKENLYQSLHTAVMGPGHRPLEVQIRNTKMHREAEDGIAAHWSYKEGDRHKNRSDSMFERAVADLKRSLIEDQSDVSGDLEYVKNVTTDFLTGQIFVFTPQGDVIELPRGSTPLDFAYKVHTELGHRCCGAKANGRIVPLAHELKSGDIVEVMRTSKPRGPKLDWLNPHHGFLKTDSAKTKVRAWFRRQERATNLARGKAILEREYAHFDIKAPKKQLAEWLGYDDVAELEIALGTGNLLAEQMTEKLVPKLFTPDRPAAPPPAPAQPQPQPQAPAAPAQFKMSDVMVMGAKQLQMRVPKCCTTIRYGDPIIGYVTRGKGVSIHRPTCTNRHKRSEDERWVPLSWGHAKTTTPTTLSIRADNRLGLIRDITSILSEEHANIEAMHSITAGGTDARETEMEITIHTAGSPNLSRIINRLRTVQGMIKISKGGGAKRGSAPNAAKKTAKRERRDRPQCPA